MPRTPHRPQLPAYALYGESTLSPGMDGLHLESIAARSRLHDWEIRPHRHAQLFQFLYLRRGGVELTLDAGTRSLRGPCVVAVPPMTAHGFRFDAAVDGTVVTLSEALLPRLFDGAPGLRERLSHPCVLALRRGQPPWRDIDAALGLLRTEFAGSAAWRSRALDAALLRMLLCVGRALPPAGERTAAQPERALAHVQRYRGLVEAGFRQPPPLAELAAAVGVSTTHLNRACRQVLGQSALGVLHARITLEAQRELAYTAMSVKQIGLGLGFDDAGYFTRFFQRATGATPSRWRAEAMAVPA
jgi:AraC family transcriptional regulator, transcriptional activator of pobA